jgi:septal ring factor EnvC (AmiA/AmiB activator)
MSLEAKINTLVEENRKLKEILEKTATHISELEEKINERVDELVELRMTDKLKKEVVDRVVRGGDRREGMKMPAPSTFSGNST